MFGVHEAVSELVAREAWMRDVVAPLGSRDLPVASVLPGWSIAHVLVHLARNADSHRHRIVAAPTGAIVDQYAGGVAGRAREIENGVRRSARAIVDDVIETSLLLDAAWSTVLREHWSATSRDVSGSLRTLDTLPNRRLQEIEVHVVDLGVGVSHRDWPQRFMDLFLEPMRASMASRLPLGASTPRISLDERDELWWLYGRGKFDGYPQLAGLGVTTDRSHRT